MIPRHSCVYDLPGSRTLRGEEGAGLGWAELPGGSPGTELTPRGHSANLHIPEKKPGARHIWEPARRAENWGLLTGEVPR